MTSTVEKSFPATSPRRRWAVTGLLVAIVAVPLAVTGLVAGALGSADQRIDAIPAVVVNNDRMVTTTGADGSKQPVLAGRQLVTELTGPNAAGFDWRISNSADAAAALKDGSAYAVLTVPRDFSASVTSLAGTDPRRANLTLRTDDAHSYLAGSAAQAVGTAMAGAFGRAITTQYLAGFYSQLGIMAGSLATAATGATEISTGAGSLASGLDTLSSGAASAAGGASALSSGVSGYTEGVRGLSAGLARLSSGASQLGSLRTQLPQYAAGVQQSADGFRPLNQALQANPDNAPYAESLNRFQAGLDALAAGGSDLGRAGAGIGTVVDGVAQSARGAERLANTSGGITAGAVNLADGVTQVSSGASSAAAAAHQLTSGASELAGGLTEGASQATAASGTKATAGVVADPVGVTVTRNHALASIGPVIGAVFVPVGLWVGALVIVLLLRPVTTLALASTASTGRLVLRGLGRGAAIAAAQAVIVVGLLHAALGVSWELLPATVAFGIFIAVVFAFLHHALAVAFGRLGIVLSLVLLAVQLTASGGLYPVQLVAQPFQALTAFLPLTWAVSGFQAIVSGGAGGDVAASVAALAVFAVLGSAVSFWVVAGRRRGRSLRFSPVVS